MNRLGFLKQLISDYKVASVTPTERHVVRRMCKSIDFSRDIVMIEYGPGNGPFTKYILGRMTSQSVLFVIETNHKCAEYLESIKDNRLHVFHGDAVDMPLYIQSHGYDTVDYVLSGIPFSLIPIPKKNTIIEQTKNHLTEDGSFLIYQFSPQIKKYVSPYFSHVSSGLALINIPPLFLFEAKR